MNFATGNWKLLQESKTLFSKKTVYFCCYCFHSGGPAVICIMGLKLLRGSFSESSRQHLVLLWTVLFFHFDYSHSSETFVVDYFFMSIFMNKVRLESEKSHFSEGQ